MIAYSTEPDRVHEAGGVTFACFTGATNVDPSTLASFGDEWSRFREFSDDEIEGAGKEYFDVVPRELLTWETAVLDAGCGSGRWSRFLAPHVGRVEAIDPSAAVFVAAAQHLGLSNVRFTQAAIDIIPFHDKTFDVVICLGVLHHVPDTAGALRDLTRKIRPGGHLLLYLYYSLDNRGAGYRAMFAVADLVRRFVSGLPAPAKRFVADVLAMSVYLPLVSVARIVAKVNAPLAERLPLGYYRNKSLRIIRDDALDRFGTPLEQRFTKVEIADMLNAAGMERVRFSENAPFWHCLSRRADSPR